MANVTVYVWPKGYASEEGTKKFVAAEGTDYARQAKELFGMWASISSVVKPAASNEVFSPGYIRAMSAGS